MNFSTVACSHTGWILTVPFDLEKFLAGSATFSFLVLKIGKNQEEQLKNTRWKYETQLTNQLTATLFNKLIKIYSKLVQ